MEIFIRPIDLVKKPKRDQEWPPLKELTAYHLQALPAYIDGWFTQRTVYDQLKKARLFSALSARNHPLFTNWIFQDQVSYPKLNIEFNLKKHWAWSAYLFVKPTHRRQGVATYYREHLLWQLQQEGIRWIGAIATTEAAICFNQVIGMTHFATYRPGFSFQNLLKDR